MPFCPRCKYEYRVEYSTCPDCNERLVDHLPMPAAVQPSDDSWVSVCRLTSRTRSDLARGALDSSNIPSIVMSSSFNAYGPGVEFTTTLSNSGAESNVLMVPKEFREEAVFILMAVLGDDFQGTEIR